MGYPPEKTVYFLAVEHIELVIQDGVRAYENYYTKSELALRRFCWVPEDPTPCIDGKVK